MAKKQFETESKWLPDLMVSSIHTHKEIFLRELISNAGDAVDKLVYRALTGDQVGLNRSSFKITLIPSQTARILTVSDNGIDMMKGELERNLDTITRNNSLQLKQELAKQENGGEHTADIIGQSGVGFYSASMVADHIAVTSRAHGSDEVWQWAPDGADGYTLTLCGKENAGIDIVLRIKQNTKDDHYDEYLEQYHLAELVKRYSDYIHYPIVMLVHKSRQKPRPEDVGDDYKPEWEDFDEWGALNSMVPLWQRPKNEVTVEEYNQFYKERYGDQEDPLGVMRVPAGGTVEYKAMLYTPTHTLYDLHSREYQRGFQLYPLGVLIMDKCVDLLPGHFRFVEGVVDSQDSPLNTSREMLQHTRQLKVIAGNLERKIKADLLCLQKDDREKYETFWETFGAQVKVGVVSDYGAHKEFLKDLLPFFSSREGKLTSLVGYKAHMSVEQKYIYYTCGEDAGRLAKLPQAEHIRDKGYETLYLAEELDQLVIDALGAVDGAVFKLVNDTGAFPEIDEKKATLEQKVEESKSVLDLPKETPGDVVKEVRVPKILESGTVCLTADGLIILKMEKYLQRMDLGDTKNTKIQRMLELNPDSATSAASSRAVESNRDKTARYVKFLYARAQLVVGSPLEDPAGYIELMCSLMN